MSWKKVFSISVLSVSILSACDNSENYAPVTDINTIDPIPKVGVHKAVRRETLYEIAWRYGLDYKDLEKRNHMHAADTVRKGRVIYLRAKPSQQPIAANKVDTNTTFVNITPVVSTNKLLPVKEKEANIKTAWIWPTKGRIIHHFSNANKGINIVGSLGEPIYASAAGKVVYAGNGLRGYGNLIIIKHNHSFMSAYAYNKKLLVREGSMVTQGQKIAEMGDTGADKVMLHFEIRRAGQPVNPLTLLNSNRI